MEKVTKRAFPFRIQVSFDLHRLGGVSGVDLNLLVTWSGWNTNGNFDFFFIVM